MLDKKLTLRVLFLSHIFYFYLPRLFKSVTYKPFISLDKRLRIYANCHKKVNKMSKKGRRRLKTPSVKT